MFPPGWRSRALAALGEPFDLVVLGGGINGCAVLLDAAQRGLRVLLVERGDLASGTSSRSSKLIHGGLRYLRQLQWRVTRASCRERDRLLRLSPHLAEPIEFIYPAYRGERTKGWKVELGLKIYDRLTDSPERHRRLTSEELAGLVPGLDHAGLERILAYRDARTDDARLTLAVAATAVAYGGRLLTRATLEEGVDDTRGRLSGLVIRDLESGAVHRVEASLVVNATGVWVDEIRDRLGRDGRRVRPSRGSHLLFPSSKLPLEAAVVVRSPGDEKPVFYVPHPEGVLVGTTDLFHDGPLDDPRPSRQEVDHLLRTTNHAFPDRRLTLDDAAGAFAGLRPILDHQARDPAEASREEGIWEEDGLLSVAGGKLTTWRLTAEEVVDAALALLPPERARRAARCSTHGTPLAGLAPADLTTALVQAQGLERPMAGALARRLGALAWQARELARDAGDLRPLAGTDLTVAELRAHLRYGAVLHLSDLFLRRVRIAMWSPRKVADVLPEVRSTVCEELGWDGARWDQECELLASESAGWTIDLR